MPGRSRIWQRSSLAGFTLILAVFTFGLASGQAPATKPLTLKDVMLRAHAYVVEYEDHRLSGVLAEERYEQKILDRQGAVERTRTLVSEYLIFQLPPDESWFAVRNVIEVDGQPVPDHQQLLAQLLSRSPGDVIEQAMKIDEQSARYNIGDVHRTINLPTFALAFLRPINRQRVHFEKMGEETIDGTGTWMIRFEDLRRPAFITTPSGDGLPCSGRFWIDPVNGRVIRSELVTRSGSPPSIRGWGTGRQAPGPSGTIRVTYRADDTLGFWVPAVMDERYDDDRHAQSPLITGTARYLNFRRLDLTALRRQG